MKPFTAEDARRTLQAKLAKAGAKGATSLWTPSTAEPKRALLQAAADVLESEGALFIDRRKAKPRYFAGEHRPALPTAESVARRLEESAGADYPALATRARWKAALKKFPGEAELLERALAQLLEAGALLRLLYRKASAAEEVFVAARCVTNGGSSQGVPPRLSTAERKSGQDALTTTAVGSLDPQTIHAAYCQLAEQTGFPAVPIAQLHTVSGTPLAELQAWLLAEHTAGRAILSRGDWSLAGEDKRLAAVTWQGHAHLHVRLLS